MKLFYDDEFDAIATAIGNSGKPFKIVAAHMFPDLKPESAYAKLKACCSPTGTERLTFGQVIRLMAFCEQYDPLLTPATKPCTRGRIARRRKTRRSSWSKCSTARPKRWNARCGPWSTCRPVAASGRKHDQGRRSPRYVPHLGCDAAQVQ
jgi:hypothetical protein